MWGGGCIRMAPWEGSLPVSQIPQAGQKGLNIKLRALVFDSLALGSH